MKGFYPYSCPVATEFLVSVCSSEVLEDISQSQAYFVTLA